MVERQYQRIVAAHKAIGGALQPGCTAEQLEKPRGQVPAQRRGRVPEDYRAFLKLMNGLDYNSFSIYGSETTPIVGHPQVTVSGMVEANLGLRHTPSCHAHLLYGELPPLLYASDLTGTKFGSFDQTSLDQVEAFSSFEEMLDAALAEANIR